MSTALAVNDLWKSFRLYHERNQYLKAAILKMRRVALRGVLGAQGRRLRGADRLDVRCHRLERLGQEHAAEVHGRHPAYPRRAACLIDGRVSALLELGAGFHPELSGRENVFLNGAILGLVEEGDHRPLRRHRRVRRARRVHRHAGEELLVGHVRPARLRRRRTRRTRRAADRRSAVGRRRELPAQVRREDRRVPPRRPHDRVRQPRLSARSSNSARTSPGSTRANSPMLGPANEVIAALPGREPPGRAGRG